MDASNHVLLNVLVWVTQKPTVGITKPSDWFVFKVT